MTDSERAETQRVLQLADVERQWQRPLIPADTWQRLHGLDRVLLVRSGCLPPVEPDAGPLAEIPTAMMNTTTAITITEEDTVMRGGEWVIPEDYQTADLSLDESRVAPRAPCDGFYLLANEIAKGSEV